MKSLIKTTVKSIKASDEITMAAMVPELSVPVDDDESPAVGVSVVDTGVPRTRTLVLYVVKSKYFI